MNQLETAIFSKLTGASSLTALLNAGTASVYHRQAPENADPPYVIFGKQARTPVRVVGGGAVAWEDALYLVKAVDASPSALNAGSIASRIDETLDRASLSVTGYTSLACHRDSDVDYVENAPGGQVIQHRGALYRIQVQPT